VQLQVSAQKSGTEAADDREVWTALKNKQEAPGDFVEAFGEGRNVSEPGQTVAKIIADGHSGQVRHVDIRADASKLPLVAQRDDAMAAKIMQILESSESVIVIVGEEHRLGVSDRLEKQGLEAVKKLIFWEKTSGYFGKFCD